MVEPIPDDMRKRQLLSQIQRRIWSHALTVRISEIVGDREHSWNTATGILVQLQNRLVAITAWHVVKRFIDIRERGGLPVLILGNLPLAEPRSIFLDSHNDLVVLEVPTNDQEATMATPYEPSRQWPPPRVTLDDAVLICGFPALYRQDSDEILHADLSFLGSVESVSEHQFVVQIDPDNVIDAGRVPFPAADADLGGMSGSPAFAIYSDHMQLVGIFSQSAMSAPVWLIRSLAHLPVDLASRPSHSL